VIAPACAQETRATRPRTLHPPATQPFVKVTPSYLLHLPGIGGLMPIDRLLSDGLRDGRFFGQIDVYDWTRGNSGLLALTSYERNREEAKQVARMIEQAARRDPESKIILTGHSAGAGIAVWALEDLPADVHIDALVLLAPAISPEYDLSAALRHVKRAYAFISAHDPILGPGTRAFGTIDRVRSDSAGRVGFKMPESGDAREYGKLHAIPYDKAWMRYGNIGDHVGPMMRPFARVIIAPVLLTGELPPTTTQPATAPATQRSQ
jgi:pimeloyl-ACP methyl ester carboxylesterase